VAGNYVAIAAVVARPAQNDDTPVDTKLAQLIGHAAASVFHQHNARHTVLVAGAAVQLATLLAV
jgi:hypothetical protein